MRTNKNANTINTKTGPVKSASYFLENHYIRKLDFEYKEKAITKKFSPWIIDSKTNNLHLMLYPFCNERPFKYIDENIISLCNNYLLNNSELAIEAFKTLDREIRHSINTFFKKGITNNEDILDLRNIQNYLDFETIWHPEYIRYCEHIFNHLIKIPLFILGRKKQKDYFQPTLSNRVDILKKNDLELFTRGFNPIVRNAISHGSFEYSILSINYSDKTSNNKRDLNLSTYEFGNLIDDIIITCNSLIISYCLFFSNLERVGVVSNLPLGFLFLYIKGLSEYDNIKIDNLIVTKTINSSSQLIFYISSKYKSRFEHNYNCMVIAYRISKIGFRDYDRLGFEIDFGAELNGQVFFNMKKFNEFIETNKTFDDKLDFIEDSINWYDTKFKILKVRRFKTALKYIFRIIRINLLDEWSQKGLYWLSRNYIIKDVENSSTDKKVRVKIYVALSGVQFKDERQIIAMLDKVIKEYKKKRYHRKKMTKNIMFKKKPDYIWVYLYLNEFSLRKLKSQGWENSNHLLTAEWIRNRKRNASILLKDSLKEGGNIKDKDELRIFYNPNNYIY